MRPESDRRAGRGGLAGQQLTSTTDVDVGGGVIVEGQKVLLFSYGYGAHWTGLALEI